MQIIMKNNLNNYCNYLKERGEGLLVITFFPLLMKAEKILRLKPART